MLGLREALDDGVFFTERFAGFGSSASQFAASSDQFLSHLFDLVGRGGRHSGMGGGTGGGGSRRGRGKGLAETVVFSFGLLELGKRCLQQLFESSNLFVLDISRSFQRRRRG